MLSREDLTRSRLESVLVSVRNLRKWACRVARPLSWVLTLRHRAAILLVSLSPSAIPLRIPLVMLRKVSQHFPGICRASERAWAPLASLAHLPSDLRQLLILSSALPNRRRD